MATSLEALPDALQGWPEGNSPAVFAAARAAAEKIKSLPIAIDDAGMTTDQIRAFGQMEKARGARLLIVDNMKHIRYRSKGSTTEQFREVAQELKWIRDDLDMPLIVLHHLNKDGDVSWSDDIRRDADLLLFLSIDKSSIPYTPENHWCGRTIINIDCEKARDGRRNFSVQSEFLPQFQTFVDRNRSEEGGTHERTDED
jgi:replicative DNA helicase